MGVAVKSHEAATRQPCFGQWITERHEADGAAIYVIGQADLREDWTPANLGWQGQFGESYGRVHARRRHVSEWDRLLPRGADWPFAGMAA